MKTLNIIFMDNDFKRLQTGKKQKEKKDKRAYSWRDYLLLIHK